MSGRQVETRLPITIIPAQKKARTGSVAAVESTHVNDMARSDADADVEGTRQLTPSSPEISAATNNQDERARSDENTSR